MNEESEKMKALFKNANNLIVEEEKSMHINIAIKDQQRELEHKFRDTQRKLQEISELYDIEQERNEMISERTKSIDQLLEDIEIPKDLSN